MLGYVNLMIIKLLMMKLHGQVIYIYRHTHTHTHLCFCSKLVKYDIVVDELLMNSYSIDVVVMRCCC